MERGKCNNCPYLKVYYTGTERNPVFSERCYWTLKKPEDVKPEECKQNEQDN